jgi:hypothetical protein
VKAVARKSSGLSLSLALEEKILFGLESQDFTAVAIPATAGGVAGFGCRLRTRAQCQSKRRFGERPSSRKSCIMVGCLQGSYWQRSKRSGCWEGRRRHVASPVRAYEHHSGPRRLDVQHD